MRGDVASTAHHAADAHRMDGKLSSSTNMRAQECFVSFACHVREREAEACNRLVSSAYCALTLPYCVASCAQRSSGMLN